MQPFFSIIIVCLNSGKRLKSTLESVEEQTFHKFEVIIKDGRSEDGSLSCAYTLSEKWERDPEAEQRIRIFSEQDAGIYDAMNQAAKKARGRYIYYLNSGDRFYSPEVLQEMADFIGKFEVEDKPGIYYGNVYERQRGQRVMSNPHMDAFGCYRNVPCHQACFYSAELVREHPFHTQYRVRADYEQFLWCFFEKGAQNGVRFACKDILVVDYEGGGFSETGENRKISAREHRAIAGHYFSQGQLIRYRLIMLLTLSALRTRLAENEKTAGLYNRLKKALYAGKKR